MPEIIVSDPESEPALFTERPAPPPEPATDEEPPAHAAEPTHSAERIPPWRNGPKRDLTNHDHPEDEQPDDEEEYEDDEPETPRRRWNPRGSGTHTRPTWRQTRPVPRQTPAEWWRHIPARNRWALYNGAAIGAGCALHLPQWVTAETAYLVATYHSWTDIHVYTWYCLAALVWACDHQTRTWHWLLALPARIPLVSIVVGVLLYGAPNPAA
jgi:hypothetical protein